MSISLISNGDVLVKKSSSSKVKNSNSSSKNIKTEGIVEDSKYKTYSIKHGLNEKDNDGLNLDKFFWSYNEVLNSIIRDIWDTIEWKEWKIEKEVRSYSSYNQKRLYPNYRKDSLFKKDIRDHYLSNWKYSTHWIDSAISTAFSILDSWKKNYNKGRRKRNCPVAKRLFVRVKQTMMKIEGDKLRISIKPHRFIYIDLSKRYFKINGRIGEPILTPTHIHLPLSTYEDNNKTENKNKQTEEIIRPVEKIGWDLNKFSMDGFSPELGWIRIGLNNLHTAHIVYDNKRRRINKLASKKKVVGKRLKKKYSKREKNRCSQICHDITNKIKKIVCKHGFEDLDKYGMFKRSKKWNRELGYTNWKSITDQMEYKSDIKLVDPYHTSKECSRCGCVNKDLKGEKFVCANKDCGLVINRQPNAAINIYLKMEGLSHNIGWFDENVSNKLRGFTQTGAECAKSSNWLMPTTANGTARKETNELVRSLYDLMKPQFYGVGNSKNGTEL